MARAFVSATAVACIVIASVAVGGAARAAGPVTEFTTVGSTTWNVPAGVTAVDVLIVGGGGGGGGVWGGGGGGGGVLYGSCISVTPGASIPVVVGAGGAGGSGIFNSLTNRGASGGSSSFGAATAVGGGGGGGYAWAVGEETYGQRGTAGGSGGGHGELPSATAFLLGAKSTQAAPTGYAAYGNSGGTSTGATQSGSGGGGAGGAGLPVLQFAEASAGGAGITFSISGTSRDYAGGGGGGGGSGGAPGGVGGSGGGGNGGKSPTIHSTSGAPNTGGGGGGGGQDGPGGNGGSGIVIVRAYDEGATCTTAAARYAITVTAGTGGSATSSPTFVDANGSTTLAAEAVEGQSFVSWSCTGGTLSSTTANPTTLSNITADTTCTARFSGDPAPTDPLSITTESVRDGKVGETFEQSITTAGGTGTPTFAVTDGDLPPGLTLSADGTISGTPTEAGDYTVTITATADGESAQVTLTITIAPAPLSFTVDELPAGEVDQPYEQTLTTEGGTEDPTFTITDGDLPPGLELSEDGVISGTPTDAGDYTVTITATAGEETAEVTLTLTIAPASTNGGGGGDSDGGSVLPDFMAFTGLTPATASLVGTAGLQVLAGFVLLGYWIAYRRRMVAPNRALIRWMMLNPTIIR
jgi:hypothetical protein